MLYSSDSDDEIIVSLLSDLDDSDSESSTRRQYRRVNMMTTFNDAEFTFRFRLNKAAVELLLGEITPFIRVTSKRNNGVSPLHQLLLTLRFYALGTMLTSVADFVGVSQSTASRIVTDISAAIAMLYDNYVVVHTNSADIFYRIAQFPRVNGAVDGTHVQIQSPCSEIGEEFRNRKGYFSVNVQGVCDGDLKFTNVVARWPGSTHDATIFNNSVLRVLCESGTLGNQWLLGDSAYPNRSYLLIPILNPTTPQEIRYNEAHIKTRNTIERTFGIWKRRFPVISLKIRLSLLNIQKVIIATAVLHNICRLHNIQEVPPETDINVSHVGSDRPTNEELHENDISNRSNLVNNYF